MGKSNLRRKEYKGRVQVANQGATTSRSRVLLKYFRTSQTRYEELLRLVSTHITEPSIRREAIEPGESLAVTFLYIFAGISEVDFSGSFWVSPTSIGRIINETCNAIWNILSEQNLVKALSNEEE